MITFTNKLAMSSQHTKLVWILSSIYFLVLSCLNYALTYGTLSLQVADCFHIMQERYFLQQNSVLRKNKSVFSSSSRGTGGYGSKHTERILSSKKKIISKRSLPKSLSGKRKAGTAVKGRRRNEIKRTKLRNDVPSDRHGHSLERSKKVSRQVPATSIRNRSSNKS